MCKDTQWPVPTGNPLVLQTKYWQSQGLQVDHDAGLQVDHDAGL